MFSRGLEHKQTVTMIIYSRRRAITNDLSPSNRRLPPQQTGVPIAICDMLLSYI